MSDTLHYPELNERVRSQKTLQPELYGQFDFDTKPYRLATELDDKSSLPRRIADRAEILANDRLVELISTATMLGDVVADPYASLMSSHSVKSLIDMLRTACQHGIDAVPDAPAEFRAFISAMEEQPSWLDMDLVERGAREARVPAALASPFAIRGAFVATFSNTYAALPMALTGALGSERKAARRVNETASFFAVTTLPGALERFGPGFEAAAMVRLMHSMVRYNALHRSDRWDTDVYGVPIPQVDQVPAGLIDIYLIAARARKAGRSDFNDRERASVEFSRYRCFLLGLPEELLPTSIEGIRDVMHARAAMLRDDFDDEVCGGLVRATMQAYLRPSDHPLERIANSVERSYGKMFYLQTFGRSKSKKGPASVVHLDNGDKAKIAATAPFIFGRIVGAAVGSRVPVVNDIVDLYATQMVKQRLTTYGRPKYTTDAATYTPTASASQ